MNDAVVVSSRDVLAHHAKSFKWAAFFLPPDARDDAAVLYAFCRHADDLADESPSHEIATARLSELRAQLDGDANPTPLVSALLELADRRAIKIDYVHQLLEGMLSDTKPVRVQNDAELLRYCYRVAGTVGLMMCPILGVQEQAAFAHAIDLGVAMQLTNICRDVLEDSGRDRVYLPATRLSEKGSTHDAILTNDVDHNSVAEVVKDLLELADRYYESAHAGMSFIPRRTRFAIHVASALYHDIGTVLGTKHNYNAMHGRSYVPTGRKMRLVASKGFGFFFGAKSHTKHDSELHLDLRGLPGIR